MNRFIACLWTITCFGTVQFARTQQPPTVEAVLHSHGITVSISSLRQALLYNSDPEIRGLAAVELAHLKDSEAIPLVRDRYEKATTLSEKRSMSVALLAFSDPLGHSGMLNICRDASVREDDRVIAAQQLDMAGDSACFGPLVELLSSAAAFGTRQSILEFLKQHPLAQPPSMEILQEGLEKSLRDESPATRENAGECIVLFKVKGASRSLRQAIARENVANIRGKLQQNLEKLQTSLIQP